jgi:hypothetical protein
MGRVFLSPMLSPKECRRARHLLIPLFPSTEFTDSYSDAISLRISTANEIIGRTTNPENVFTVTPLCLSQMLESNLDPFTFRPKRTHSLVNIFLFGKVLSIVSLGPEDTNRLTSIILQMCGVIGDIGKETNYVISPRLVKCTAIVVRPCWIDALFSSELYIEPADFIHKKEATISLSQRPSIPKGRRTPGHLVLVPDRSQTFLPFPPVPAASQSKGKLPFASHTPSREGSQSASLDRFFVTKPRSRPESAEGGSDITIQHIERELAHGTLKKLEQNPPAETPGEELSDDVVEDPQPRMRPTELDTLCERLLRARSRPGSVEHEPGGEEMSMQKLRVFSQADEEQGQPLVFDVAYGADPVTARTDDNPKTDPLLDVLAS